MSPYYTRPRVQVLQGSWESKMSVMALEVKEVSIAPKPETLDSFLKEVAVELNLDSGKGLSSAGQRVSKCIQSSPRVPVQLQTTLSGLRGFISHLSGKCALWAIFAPFEGQIGTRS